MDKKSPVRYSGIYTILFFFWPKVEGREISYKPHPQTSPAPTPPLPKLESLNYIFFPPHSQPGLLQLEFLQGQRLRLPAAIEVCMNDCNINRVQRGENRPLSPPPFLFPQGYPVLKVASAFFVSQLECELPSNHMLVQNHVTLVGLYTERCRWRTGHSRLLKADRRIESVPSLRRYFRVYDMVISNFFASCDFVYNIIELRTITDKLTISADHFSTSETILQEPVQEICDDALWNTNTEELLVSCIFTRTTISMTVSFM
ncbi:hypothetical protein BC938DRAFT_473406 [Jimgerdemannia flammicorona]|uniref:Uncharacterized protein n=1 Tax=Jimgerdemannia flammicorona TaxID=994334 RepID=A0A433Q407_9FUNG|nr:hypothetical protein BC938DRAFT_473406 [Jimgerdemannia flammicorona]